MGCHDEIIMGIQAIQCEKMWEIPHWGNLGMIWTCWVFHMAFPSNLLSKSQLESLLSPCTEKGGPFFPNFRGENHGLPLTPAPSGDIGEATLSYGT